jgi:hypothetical protein
MIPFPVSLRFDRLYFFPSSSLWRLVVRRCVTTMREPLNRVKRVLLIAFVGQAWSVPAARFAPCWEKAEPLVRAKCAPTTAVANLASLVMLAAFATGAFRAQSENDVLDKPDARGA